MVAKNWRVQEGPVSYLDTAAILSRQLAADAKDVGFLFGFDGHMERGQALREQALRGRNFGWDEIPRKQEEQRDRRKKLLLCVSS